MTTATLTPDVHGAAPTPRAGTWQIDPRRAVVAFSGKAAFLAPTISARFVGVTGSVSLTEGFEPGRIDGGEVDVSVDVRSITTGNRAWDEAIGTFDPFDAKRHPAARYRSTSVEWSGNEAHIQGFLTLRGVTASVPLTASYLLGRHDDKMIVRASGTIDREDFGVRFDVPGCGKLVPRRMRLEIDVDVVHQF